MAKRKPIQKPSVPEWVLTYGDLMSLLLTFFILLAAFSELKKEEDYQKVVDAIREAFGYTGGQGNVPSTDLPLNSMSNVLENFGMYGELSKNMLTNTESVIAGQKDRTTTIREGEKFAIGGSLPFEAGSAELTDEVKARLLRDIVPKMRGRTSTFEIRGHAWGAEDLASGLDLRDLSYQRARAVARHLTRVGEIDPGILSLVARADHEPVTISRSSPGGVAQNRRVQILMTEETQAQRHPDPNWTGQP